VLKKIVQGKQIREENIGKKSGINLQGEKSLESSLNVSERGSFSEGEE
jgi:hypothetical protein